MVRNLTIVIQCGPKTCYDTHAKKMCDQVLTRRFGTEWVCGVFHRKGEPVALQDSRELYLQRCPECLAAADR